MPFLSGRFTPRWRAHLVDLLGNQDPIVRQQAVCSVDECAAVDQDVISDLIPMLSDIDASVKRLAGHALAQL